MAGIARDIVDLIGNTPLVQLNRVTDGAPARVLAKLEFFNPAGSVKDRIGWSMIAAAERDGRISPDRTVIVEPTSGNTGIALAMVARRKEYPITVVLPDNASEERIGLLQLYGAEIVFSPGDEGTNGSIEVARALARDDRYFMPFQFGNPANPQAHYEGTGAEIVRDLPEVTHFVAGLGTGGTLTGTGRRLHEHNPDIRVVAAEPELGGLIYGLRSLEEGFVPPVFDETVIDRKFLVNSSDAIRATRELVEREGIFAGVSSGAVVHVAWRVIADLEEADVVCLLADGGWKYLSTGAWAPEIEQAEKGISESLWW